MHEAAIRKSLLHQPVINIEIGAVFGFPLDERASKFCAARLGGEGSFSASHPWVHSLRMQDEKIVEECSIHSTMAQWLGSRALRFYSCLFSPSVVRCSTRL